MYIFQGLAYNIWQHLVSNMRQSLCLPFPKKVYGIKILGGDVRNSLLLPPQKGGGGNRDKKYKLYREIQCLLARLLFSVFFLQKNSREKSFNTHTVQRRLNVGVPKNIQLYRNSKLPDRLPFFSNGLLC